MTPGPWTDYHGDIVAVVDDEPYVVCRNDWRISDDDPRWKADAAAICALPALIAAAREARACLSAASSHHGTAVKGCEKCRRASAALSALDLALNAALTPGTRQT